MTVIPRTTINPKLTNQVWRQPSAYPGRRPSELVALRVLFLVVAKADAMTNQPHAFYLLSYRVQALLRYPPAPTRHKVQKLRHRAAPGLMQPSSLRCLLLLSSDIRVAREKD